MDIEIFVCIICVALPWGLLGRISIYVFYIIQYNICLYIILCPRLRCFSESGPASLVTSALEEFLGLQGQQVSHQWSECVLLVRDKQALRPQLFPQPGVVVAQMSQGESAPLALLALVVVKSAEDVVDLGVDASDASGAGLRSGIVQSLEAGHEALRFVYLCIY